NYGIDTGNGFGTGSNAIRFSNTNWGTSNSVTLDLKQAATAKGVDDGVYTSLMANNPAICFQYIMDADFGGFQDGSRSILELQGADGKGFMALEAYTKNNASDDITLNLIALNAEKTENVRYELAKGKSQVFKAVHSAKVYVDTANNAYQLAIDSEAVNLPSHGEWIPVSTTSEIGRASQRTTIVPQAIKIDNKNANWYGGVVLDTLSINNWQKVNFVGEAESPIKPMSMWYRTPAQKWAESLPLGNGRVGAMVWGDVLNDTVSLNDVTAWSGEDHKDKNLDKDNTNAIGQKIIKDIQDELKKPTPDQGKLNTLLQLWGGESNKQNGTHRPFGKLNFKFKAPTADVENYRRSLDLQTAVSSVDYKVGTALYNREAFVSNPDQVMAMKYTATESGKITFDVNFGTEDINGGKGTTTAGADYLAWNGEVHNQTWKNNETGETDAVENPVKTFAYLKAIPTGGSVTYDADGLHVKDAD
ncbi:MAG: glycoside hydrolase family 95 protein, partial [Oscillospiraceae bacterium]